MNWRKWHRIVSLVILAPLSLMTVTGIVLQLRNQFESIQPKAISSTLETAKPFLKIEDVFSVFPEKDVDQIIYRPGKTNLSIRMKDGTEVQVHPQTGEILKKAPRLTNVLIDFHQGTWMGAIGQYGLHLPAGLGLMFLIISGLIIYPFKKRKTL